MSDINMVLGLTGGAFVLHVLDNPSNALREFAHEIGAGWNTRQYVWSEDFGLKKEKKYMYILNQIVKSN